MLENFNGALSIDPVIKITGGKILPVPDGCTDDPAYGAFRAAYLRQGQVYSVSFGGTPAGLVTLRDPNSTQGSTRVQYDGVASIKGRVKALATNRTVSGQAFSARKAPTAEERRLALDLASKRFVESGVPAKIAATVSIENLTHTNLKTSPYPTLVGSFSLPIPGPEGRLHGLFFIASEHDGRLFPELVWIHLASGETDSEELGLVDHADLFGDGSDEVVAVLGFYENYRYRIYRRTSEGHWDQIFETDTLGCE